MAVIVFPTAAVFVAYVAVPDTVNTSLVMRSSAYVTVALVPASYVLPADVMVTTRVLLVMVAVVDVVVLWV